ncbi:hypothetical protein MT418_008225 [Batrachochytrium dendrobatidis]
MTDISKLLTEYTPRLKEILAKADLEVLSIRKLRTQAESELKVDLTEYKNAFQELVMSLTQDVSCNASSKENNTQVDTMDESLDNSKTDTDDDKTDDDAIVEIKSNIKSRRNIRQHLFGTSNSLAQLLGTTDPISRIDLNKQLWHYIKEHNLQDPIDRRFILCDEKLKAVMKSKRVNMFSMNKKLSNHLYSDYQFMHKKASLQEQPVVEPKPPKRKRGSDRLKLAAELSPLNEPRVLSPEFASIVGVSELSRAQALKEIWLYIKDKKLQDPLNKRMIICDEKFKNMFKVDQLDMYQMNRGLGGHMVRKEEYSKQPISESHVD